jgi:hypothetical protein
MIANSIVYKTFASQEVRRGIQKTEVRIQKRENFAGD